MSGVEIKDSLERLNRLRREGGGFKISGVCRFLVGGLDATRYLNGQVSNDVRKLEPGVAMQACVLSAKGRLEAVVLVWRRGSEFVVESDAALAESLQARLEKYIVADDVTVAPCPFEPNIHVFGHQAEALGGESPESIRVSRVGVPGVDLAPSIAIGTLEVIEADPDSLELLRIERRVPRWGAELMHDTLPAEAGLDLTAVDFHKGCYIGQEVVSRIQSVGHVNRTLRSIQVDGPGALAAGMEIYDMASPAKRVGVTTTSAYHFGLSRWVGLCYLKIDTAPDAALVARSGPVSVRVSLSKFSND